MVKFTNIKNIIPLLLKGGKSFSRSKIVLPVILFFNYLLITTGILAQPAPVAHVNPPAGGFNITGTLKANTAVGDWAAGTGSGGYVFQSNGEVNGSLTAKLIPDAFNSNSDLVFSGSAFSDNPNTWRWSASKATNKCDINNGMYLVTSSPTSKWVIMGGDRLTTTGTSYIDFEFLQGVLTRNTNNDGFTSLAADGLSPAPHNGRTEGDFVLSMEYTNGGAVATVHYYRWEESGGVYKYVEKPIPSENGQVSAFGSTNSATTDALNATAAFGKSTYIPFAFVEAAVNIDAILAQNCEGLSIKTLFIKTKASDSYNAALKDFVEPQEVDFQFGSATINYGGPYCKTGTATPVRTGASGGQYTATPAGLNINASTGVIDLANSDPGLYTVTYTFAAGGGCNKLATDEVRIFAIPGTPVLSVVNNCDGTSTVTAKDSDGNNIPSGELTWSNNSSGNPITVTALTAITATRTVNGCTSAASTPITPAPRTTPQAPILSKVDNCNGTTTITARDNEGNLIAATQLTWSNGANTNPITVNTTDQVNAIRTVNGCPSTASTPITPAPKSTPEVPVLSKVDNCDGTTTITAKDAAGNNIPAGELTWSNSSSGNPITVTATTAITAIRTVNGCPSSSSSPITPAPKTTPAAPVLSKVDNCNGTTTITAKDAAGNNIPSGELTWSNSATGNPITVTATTAITATRTVNGCTSPASASISPGPKTTPQAPVLSKVDNCDGTTTITAKDGSGTNIPASELTWSTGATTNPISVSTTTTITVTRSINGCTGSSSSITPAPKTTPVPPNVQYIAPGCEEATFKVRVYGTETNPVIVGATYTLFDKNGNTLLLNGIPIAGTTPVTPENTNEFYFENIPAGSGFKVTVNKNGCISNLAVCQPQEVTRSLGPTSEESGLQEVKPLSIQARFGSPTSVQAAPNPFTDKVRFTFQSDVSGHGSLEIYNTLGQKIATVYQGYVEAGRQLIKEYTVPVNRRTSLIYVFRVGNQKTTGKLLNW